MKRESLYRKTVDILYQAYFNDTLRHGNCYACACGNLVAANMGFEFERSEEPFFEQHKIHWKGTKNIYSPFNDKTVMDSWFNATHKHSNHPPTKKSFEQVKSTGYSVSELTKIEREFERASYGNNDEDHMFNGLVAVLKVLDKIHEVNVEESTTSKNKFEKHYQTLVNA